MQHIKLIIIGTMLALLLVRCGSDNSVDPTMLSGEYRGITYTNDEGDIIGPVDESDWRLYWDDPLFNTKSETYKTGLGVLPYHFSIKPAYPNPSNGIFTLEISLPIACYWIVVVTDTDENVLFNRSDFNMAGYVDCEIIPGEQDWNLSNYGVFRVHYWIDSSYSGYGDIWYTKELPNFE